MMKLPLLDSVGINHVNATPDGKYALRILESYRHNASTKWIVEGLSDGEKILYNHMNEDQDKRVEELDKAIAILRRELK
jgi:hypothetical protein